MIDWIEDYYHQHGLVLNEKQEFIKSDQILIEIKLKEKIFSNTKTRISQDESV